MRVVVTLSLCLQEEDCRCPGSVAGEWECGRADRREPDSGDRGRVVSIFFGGPHDEHVRRDIPQGEHIVEDPAFEPLGFYGLVTIDRGGFPVVQGYRWIESR
jgi:hypothetical protein